jgi:hypothetical protein
MNIAEVKELLTEISVIDNRKLSQEVAEGWHSILSFMPLDIAREALRLARKDDRISWLEPKHLVSWGREAAFKLDRNKPKDEEVLVGSPMPVCKQHNEPIMSCDPCCHSLHKFQEANGNSGLERFAQSEIYA